jgi:hypothetical protein
MAFALASDGALGVGVGVGERGVAVAVGCEAVVAVGAGVGATVGTRGEVGIGAAVAVDCCGMAVIPTEVTNGAGSSSPPTQATAKITSAEGINTIELRDKRNFINTDSISF